jgi:hypothetical protein
MERPIRITLLSSLISACGPALDDSAVPAFPGDFVPPAGAWSYSGPERLIVVEVDNAYETGTYGVLDPGGGAWISEGQPSHSDASSACAGPWLLVVNQLYGDNLQFVDPETGATVGQYSVGNGNNPNGVVFWGERVFVSLYERDWLLVARWDTGEELDRIDLSPWADADGVPEASQLFLHDGLLWLTLQRLDRADWRPADEGMLLAFDPESLALVHELALGLPNPSGRWSVAGEIASVAANGAYLDGEELVLDGGLVQVDLAAARVLDPPLLEAAVGSNINDGAVHGDQAWLALDDGWAENRYEAWSLAEPPGSQGQLFEGFTPTWAWEDATDPSAGIWLARKSEGTVERRSWPDGALEESHEAALFPSWLERCSPEG